MTWKGSYITKYGSRKIKLLFQVFLGIYLLQMLSACGESVQEVTFNVPIVTSLKLDPVRTISHASVGECSGIVSARKWPGCYWMHNDSGDEPRIFLIDSLGNGVLTDSISRLDGIKIRSCRHVDWEDITYFENDLMVTDIGNNDNQRNDLTIYQFEEPDNLANDVPLKARYKMAYPNQKWGWFAKKNFDCEAAFSCDNKLYLVTKHRSDRKCTFYRFDTLANDQVNIPTLLCHADLGGMVTAADYHQNMNTLAILTYQSIWLFQNFEDDDFFGGTASWLPISARQCEAICFKDTTTLVITNEQRDIFEVSLTDFITICRLK